MIGLDGYGRCGVTSLFFYFSAWNHNTIPGGEKRRSLKLRFTKRNDLCEEFGEISQLREKSRGLTAIYYMAEDITFISSYIDREIGSDSIKALLMIDLFSLSKLQYI